jgi:hypothetical protein
MNPLLFKSRLLLFGPCEAAQPPWLAGAVEQLGALHAGALRQLLRLPQPLAEQLLREATAPPPGGRPLVGAARRAEWPAEARPFARGLPLVAWGPCDRASLRAVLHDIQPEQVYHLAGQAIPGSPYASRPSPGPATSPPHASSTAPSRPEVLPRDHLRPVLHTDPEHRGYNRWHTPPAIFSLRLIRQKVWKMIKPRATRAGLPGRCTPYSFRATGITLYISNGGTFDVDQPYCLH